MNRGHPLKRFSLLVVLVFLRPAAEGREPVYAQKAMVVAAEDHAVNIGVDVLRSGGNAVDAAVAVRPIGAYGTPFSS